ncbi:MAG: hypothetical protein K2L79_04845, partial [Bacteroidales bacterium]|nr:hypothetical protein [Bacteroidales bacterium]
CKDHHEVLGSSNLRGITEYCRQNRIVYLTTVDFLYYAFIRKKMTKEAVATFIAEVVAKGSKLPESIDIERYVPTCRL